MDSIAPKIPSEDDHDYAAYIISLQARFLANLEADGPALFVTDATGLFEAYLDALPGERQVHNCHCCRRFLETYGGLVTIDASGLTHSAVWRERDAPEFYRPAVAALTRLARQAKVSGVFLSEAEVWGKPETGLWRHFALTPPASVVSRSLVKTAKQAMAEKLEDFRNVSRALEEFDRRVLKQAMTLLESESLYRTEKVIGPARWLRDLHAVQDSASGKARRENVIWRAVATAPPGFCHPRSSIIGTLLEDIAAGLNFAEVSRRFASKMHPLQYQRPTAAPSAGNIAQAEKLVEKLGIAPSLARRFARLEEVEAVWRPVSESEGPAGKSVFSHLKPKGKTEPTASLVVPAVTMTWEKFARTVLTTARSIEFFVHQRADSYAALVTAADPDAPPILQWDRLDHRNPVSWYVYHGGSTPAEWALKAGQFHQVNAITLKPSSWGGDAEAFSHQGQGVLFILEGAKDTRSSGNALFPETLKSELHEVRSTIEAYSRSAVIGGREEASACGILLAKGGSWDARFRVKSSESTLEYQLDRWD